MLIQQSRMDTSQLNIYTLKLKYISLKRGRVRQMLFGETQGMDSNTSVKMNFKKIFRGGGSFSTQKIMLQISHYIAATFDHFIKPRKKRKSQHFPENFQHIVPKGRREVKGCLKHPKNPPYWCLNASLACGSNSSNGTLDVALKMLICILRLLLPLKLNKDEHELFSTCCYHVMITCF